MPVIVIASVNVTESFASCLVLGLVTAEEDRVQHASV